MGASSLRDLQHFQLDLLETSCNLISLGPDVASCQLKSADGLGSGPAQANMPQVGLPEPGQTCSTNIPSTSETGAGTTGQCHQL